MISSAGSTVVARNQVRTGAGGLTGLQLIIVVVDADRHIQNVIICQTPLRRIASHIVEYRIHKRGWTTRYLHSRSFSVTYNTALLRVGQRGLR